MRKINKDGLDLIKSFEGLSLKAYPDPATGGDPVTIGYGSTGKDIHMGMVWTKEQCEARLAKDLLSFEMGVDRIVKVEINDNQFSALVCFSYNVGLGALEKSTLLKLLNSGDTKSAAEQFLRWNKAAGKEMPGLTRRRQAERSLFLKEDEVKSNLLPDVPSDDDISVKLEEIEKGILK